MLKVAIFLSFLVQFCSSNHLKDGNNTFRFANTFGSNMVLQRAPLNSKLWGFGEEGQTVQLKLGNTQTFRTTVKKDQNGNSTWSIQLPAMKAGGPYTITAISFIKGFTVTISIENVLFGDVWMCAGQSNMELTVPQAFTGELELAEYADNRPNIRIFTITPKYSLKVPLVDFNQDGITQNWTVASREALTGPAWAYFSAVCWMYGRRLYDQYKIPIGLIQGDWGGTSAEAWSSPDALLECGLTKTDDSVNLRRPKTKKSDNQSKKNKDMDGSEDFLLKQIFKGSHLGESFPDSTMMKFWKRIDEKIHDSKTKLKMKKDIKSFVSKTKGMVSKFLNRVKNAHQNFQKRKGQSKHRIPKQIKPMMVSKDSLNAPGPENNHSALWNGMMAPFTRSTIKGVVWYQGEENNFVNPHLYACVFPEMINDWRKKWFEGTNGSTDQMFPFGFVQLASITDQKSLDSKYFPRIRYEQTANYGYVPNPKQQNVFMAVAMDLPDDNSPFGSIHPRDKATVADRLILGARATVYGEPDVNYRGPAIDRCLITRYQEQSVLRVDYKHLAGGIYLKSYNGFEILTTGSTAWISTEIITVTEDKQSVLVTLPSPPDIKILGVRYAWAHHPCEYKNCAVYSVNNDLPSPQDICFIP